MQGVVRATALLYSYFQLYHRLVEGEVPSLGASEVISDDDTSISL